MSRYEDVYSEQYKYRGDYRDNFADPAAQAKFLKKYETLGKVLGRLLDEEKTLPKPPKSSDPFDPGPQYLPSPRLRRVWSMILRCERQIDGHSWFMDLIEYCQHVMPDEEYWAKRQAGDNHPKRVLQELNNDRGQVIWEGSEKEAIIRARMEKNWGRAARASFRLSFQADEAERRGDTDRAKRLNERSGIASWINGQIDEILDPPPLGEELTGASYPPRWRRHVKKDRDGGKER